MPFVLGLGIAYLINPFVKWFEEKNYSRARISLGLLLCFLLLATVLLALTIPALYKQSLQLANEIPEMAASLLESIRPYTDKLGAEFNISDPQDLKNLAKENMGSIIDVIRKLAGGLAAGGQAILGFLSIIILMPVTAYFMLKEWPAIESWTEDIMPLQHKDTIKRLLESINQKIAGFIRGQLAAVCVIGLMYSVALTIAGLDYGILIGFLAGLLSIIPLLGSFTGLLASVLVAWLQSGEWPYVLIIAAIFFAGQAIEGNLITPKLVGKYVGMHPLWVLFALLAGGSLFGIVGMLLAAPVAASIGVMVNFGLEEYKKSSFYTGRKTGGNKQKNEKAGHAKS